ncbi:MAG: hypothetical protein GWN84_26475 [Gammaproteobacteria bacterium]|nr:hypothetical protein [Gammaproteobacteria bacterium]NIR85945.1 hypothetical protein [Gammaproteobacteria bacterium]NIR91937.1 hypothetical protein [Gammaproteobacteria bacterium]NIU07194.1 hypothetical protein [Gammaproteobacteria bacterium]NIV54007.1 hypothetical protein [Gammaproteobacteria bacterium]
MAHRLSVLVMLVMLVPAAAQATVSPAFRPVDVEIVADGRGPLSQYPVQRGRDGNVYRAYLEARNGQNYAVRVRNRTGHRIGLVIAVDGRNIISGAKSHLVRSERMYVLGPYQQATYKGWRTSLAQVHRFYFTEAGDSYAMAWGDDSAMGVIALAVYREKPRAREEVAKPSGDRAARKSAAPAAPGTGFGNAAQSQAVRVQFEPEHTPMARYFLKYEWRQALCDRGIIACGQRPNRFWPDESASEGFAPYPPGYWNNVTRK